MQSSRDAGNVLRGILGQISPGSNVGSVGMLTHWRSERSHYHYYYFSWKGIYLNYRESQPFWHSYLTLFLWFVFIWLRLFVPRMSDGLLICMSQGLKMDETHNFCFVDFVQDISCRKLFISACVMSHPLTQLWTHQVGQKHWCDNRQIIQDGWRLDTQYSFLNTI